MDKRQCVEIDNKKIWDDNIKNNLLNSEEYKKAKTVFIYVSMSDEVNTIEIIETMLKEGKRVAVPKVITELKAMEADFTKDINFFRETAIKHIGKYKMV